MEKLNIKALLKELEERIIEEDIYRRCENYEKKCNQCDFWKRFDLIKNNLIEVEKEF